MLAATWYGVWGAAHQYGTHLVACGVFVVLGAAALFIRSKRTKTRFLQQRPYDLAAFAAGVAVLSCFYEAPLM